MMKCSTWILGLTLLFIAVPSSAQPVERNGKEWLQPVNFVNLSWDAVEIVCPSPDYLCSGTLGSTDVTGYTWASIDNVNTLFNSYGVTPPLGPGPDFAHEPHSLWAPGFLADFFYTLSGFPTPNEEYVEGWLSNRNIDICAYAKMSMVLVQCPECSIPDLAATSGTAACAAPDENRGAWFFRNLPPVIAIKDGFIQMDATDGNAPLDGDCAGSAHNGRMVLDDVNDLLYICTDTGWKTTTLN